MQNIIRILSKLYNSLFIKEVYKVEFNNQIYFLINKDLINDYDLYLETICKLEYELNKEFDTEDDNNSFPYIIQATEFKNIENFTNKKIIPLVTSEKHFFTFNKFEKNNFFSNKYLSSFISNKILPRTNYTQKQNTNLYETPYNINQHNNKGINYVNKNNRAA